MISGFTDCYGPDSSADGSACTFLSSSILFSSFCLICPALTQCCRAAIIEHNDLFLQRGLYLSPQYRGIKVDLHLRWYTICVQDIFIKKPQFYTLTSDIKEMERWESLVNHCDFLWLQNFKSRFFVALIFTSLWPSASVVTCGEV